MPYGVNGTPTRLLPEPDLNFKRAGQRVQEDLMTGIDVRWYLCKLSAQLDVDAADNTVANVNRGDGFNLINRFSITAGGNDPWYSLSGNNIFLDNYRLPFKTPRRSVELGDGNADPNVETFFYVPTWHPLIKGNQRFTMNTKRFDTLKARCRFNGATDVIDQADGFIEEPTISMMAKVAHPSENPDDPTDKDHIIWKRYDDQIDIVQDNSNFEVELPKDARYQGFILNSYNDDVDDPSVINSITIKNESRDFVRNIDPDMLRQAYVQDQKLEPYFDGASYPDLRISDDFDRDAVYPFNRLDDGQLTETFNPHPSGKDYSQFKLVMDVESKAGDTNMDIVHDQLFLPESEDQKLGNGS
jgi:hypothetical protein